MSDDGSSTASDNDDEDVADDDNALSNSNLEEMDDETDNDEVNDDMGDNSNNVSQDNQWGETSSGELERLQKECGAMVQLLKRLEREELNMQRQVEILAQEALKGGYQPHLLEPPAPKRRKPSLAAAAKKKEEED
jgi:hypothetical protein